MTDIVNACFRRWYPPNVDRRDDRLWRYRSNHRGGGFEYEGPERPHRIFPDMLCADGFRLSAQGHFGAYCYPQNDFSEDDYQTVEVMSYHGPERTFLRAGYSGHQIGGGDWIHGDVPVALVAALIEQHGGLFDWNAAALE